MKNFRLLVFASLLVSLFIWSCSEDSVSTPITKSKRSAHVNPMEIVGIDHNASIEYAMANLDFETAPLEDIYATIKTYFVNNTTDKSIVTALNAVTFTEAEGKVGNDNFGTVSEYFAVNPDIFSNYIRNHMDDVEEAVISATNILGAENALINLEADIIAANHAEKNKALGGLAIARYSLNLWAGYLEDNGDSTFDEDDGTTSISPRLWRMITADYFAYMGELEGQGTNINTSIDEVIRHATNQAAYVSARTP